MLVTAATIGDPAAPSRDTRERILDTAEDLFARDGVMAVTLRSIAAAATVNVAAVNYHFGSKEKLFEEMFLRRIAPLNQERLARLDACLAAAGGAPGLAAIVQAYVDPVTRLASTASPSARAVVVQYSLGRVLAMPGANRMLARYYDRLRTAYVAALQTALPALAQHEVVWRYYWMGGSLMCALAVPPGLSAGAERGRADFAEEARSLIAFLVQGFQAAAPAASAARAVA